MSAEAMTWAWKQSGKCPTQGCYLVLLALAEYANPEGECFPNRSTVAQMAGFSDKGTVTRNINRLVKAGLVAKDSRFDVKREGRQTSNSYQLQLDKAQATPPVAPSGQPTPVAPAATPGNNNALKQLQEQNVAADVGKVYDHYLAIFKPERVPKLGPALVRLIEKGLKEYEAGDLCVAIDGLFEYRKRKPGKTTLGALLETHPGSGSLSERIAFFISQAKGATRVGKFPSGDRAIVAEKQRLVQRGHRLSQSEEAVQQAKDAELWLREHGIETVVNPVGVPTFRPRRDGNEGGA